MRLDRQLRHVACAHTHTGRELAAAVAVATAATQMRTFDCEHEALDIRGVCSHDLGRLAPRLDQLVVWMRGRWACVERRAAHDAADAQQAVVITVRDELHLQLLRQINNQ